LTALTEMAHTTPYEPYYPGTEPSTGGGCP
jgi:hypothetical protein